MTTDNKSGIDKTVQTSQFLDRRLDPPSYVDAELPTTTIVLGPANRKGRIRAPRGTVVATHMLTGSMREFIPGSYSARVTRVSVATGSRNMEWFIRHSRDGTYDIVSFPSPGQHTVVGGPMDPVYAFGPGSIIWGWLGDAGGLMGSAYYTSQHLEGIIGARRPDQV